MTLDDQLRGPFSPNDPSLVFALAQGLLLHLKESGATEEEAMAALRTAEAIVPLMQLRSKSFQIFGSSATGG